MAKVKSIKKNFLSLALGTALLALSAPAEAQQPGRVYRIGYLSSGTPSAASDFGLSTFRQRLREIGYVEGQNITVDYRYGELENARLTDLVAELVRRKVDVIVTSPDPPSIRAAQSATRTIPIVMPGVVVDPLETEFWDKKRRAPLVVSLSRPGGNITGLSNLASELHGKRLELLKEAFPRISRVAILWPRAQQQKQALKDIEAVKGALRIEIQSLATGNLEDFERAFSEISQARPDALLIARSQVTLNNRERVIGFATQKRLPTIFAESEFVDAGGLMSYGADTRDLYRRAATYVDKILKGANPGELPIERPTKFEFIISLKTAKQIGLTIPPNVLARADRVIR
jgi:putative tryptophan/tyrosine transport system substrate-binding protein